MAEMCDLKFGFTAQQIIDDGVVTEGAIYVIKAWLLCQKVPSLTQEQIALFLIACGNDVEATKVTILAHFRAKNALPEIFDNRQIESADLQKQLTVNQFCIFPEKTNDGCVILFARLQDTNYKHHELIPTLKLLTMLLDSTLYECPPKGLVLLVDMAGATVMHLMNMKFRIIRPLGKYFNEGLQAKLKQMHVLNTNLFVEKAMMIVKPFISTDAMHFHPVDMDMELFYEKHLPKRCLPEDYGGDLPSVSVLHQRYIDRITELQPHFEAEELQRRSLS